MNVFDRILMETGSISWFQARTYVFICAMVLGGSLAMFAQVFIGGIDDHWCRVSHWEGDNCTELGLNQDECLILKRNLSTPAPAEGLDLRCVKYNVTGISFMEAYNNHDALADLDVIACDEGWYFSRDTFTSTITEEWELVCEFSSVGNFLQSFYLVGVLVGCISFGAMADRVGRYYTIITASILSAVFGVVCAVPTNIYLFAVLRFLLGAAAYGNVLTCFVLGTEIVLPSARVYFGVLLWYLFAGGYFVLAAITRYVYSWRVQLVLLASPNVIFLPYLFLLTESPRWLLSKRKDAQAEKVIKKIAAINKREPPENLSGMIKTEADDQSSSDNNATFIELLHNRRIRFYTVNLMYNWFVQSFVYYGLSLGTSSLGVNPYFAFCISGAVEFPAYTCSIYSMKYLGRKLSTASLLIIAGFACLVTTFVPLGLVRVAFAMIGKFAISTSFANVYVHTAEIFPTPLRVVGVASCSICARIGGIIAPLILVLEKTWLPLPLILFASSSVLAGLLVYFLPETKGKPMPDTIADISALTTVVNYKPIDKELHLEENGNEGTRY